MSALSSAPLVGMVTIFCNRLGWTHMELLLGGFQARLFFGVAVELLDLIRLSPLLNAQRARVLYDAGFTAVTSLARARPKEIERVLQRANPFVRQVHATSSPPASRQLLNLELNHRFRSFGFSEKEADLQNTRSIFLPDGSVVSEHDISALLVAQAQELLREDLCANYGVELAKDIGASQPKSSSGKSFIPRSKSKRRKSTTPTTTTTMKTKRAKQSLSTAKASSISSKGRVKTLSAFNSPTTPTVDGNRSSPCQSTVKEASSTGVQASSNRCGDVPNVLVDVPNEKQDFAVHEQETAEWGLQAVEHEFPPSCVTPIHRSSASETPLINSMEKMDPQQVPTVLSNGIPSKSGNVPKHSSEAVGRVLVKAISKQNSSVASIVRESQLTRNAKPGCPVSSAPAPTEMDELSFMVTSQLLRIVDNAQHTANPNPTTSHLGNNSETIETPPVEAIPSTPEMSLPLTSQLLRLMDKAPPSQPSPRRMIARDSLTSTPGFYDDHAGDVREVAFIGDSVEIVSHQLL